MGANRLKAALRAKYGTPDRALAALGLSPDLLRPDPPRHQPQEPSMTTLRRRAAGRAFARDQEPERPIPDEDPTFTERCQLVLKFLKGRLSDEDLLKAEQLLRGDEPTTDQVEEAEREREAEPAMDGRGVSRFANRLTRRIGLS